MKSDKVHSESKEYVWLTCHECQQVFKKRRNDYIVRMKWGHTEFLCPDCNRKRAKQNFNRNGKW